MNLPSVLHDSSLVPVVVKVAGILFSFWFSSKEKSSISFLEIDSAVNTGSSRVSSSGIPLIESELLNLKE